jgi:hypothetical protein
LPPVPCGGKSGSKALRCSISSWIFLFGLGLYSVSIAHSSARRQFSVAAVSRFRTSLSARLDFCVKSTGLASQSSAPWIRFSLKDPSSCVAVSFVQDPVLGAVTAEQVIPTCASSLRQGISVGFDRCHLFEH